MNSPGATTGLFGPCHSQPPSGSSETGQGEAVTKAEVLAAIAERPPDLWRNEQRQLPGSPALLRDLAIPLPSGVSAPTITMAPGSVSDDRPNS